MKQTIFENKQRAEELMQEGRGTDAGGYPHLA